MRNNLSITYIQVKISTIKKIGAVLFLIAVHTVVLAQSVGIGTTTPNASAQLDVSSTAKGMLVPRMTTAQRTAIASPAKGLLVFDNGTSSFWFYSGTGIGEKNTKNRAVRKGEYRTERNDATPEKRNG